MLGWGTALCLLLLPLIAMRFSQEVNWSSSDFAFAIALFGSVGLGLELAFSRDNRSYRIAAAIALLVSFLAIWVSGSVGIIGNESDDANLLFIGVVAIALIGSALAFFRASGMAVAMVLAAVAQTAIPLVGMIAGNRGRDIWSPEVILVTLAFTAMWLASARLFQLAARQAPRAYI